MFSLSALELSLTGFLAIGAIGASYRGIAAARWLVVFTGCFALASLLTPADLASTVLFAPAFLACFYLGTKQKTPRTSPSA